MGQANRKNVQKADKLVQTEDVATGSAEDVAQKKPRSTELRGWLKGFPIKIISESTQTQNPPRQSLDDQIYEVRERAWPTLVRFKVPGINRERVGFFISNDGYFVTELTPQFSHVEEATDAFDRRLEVEHVEDMSCHVNVSVLKVKRATRTPFLRPLPDTGYAMVPEEEEQGRL
ncbi:hypothetical protein PHYSODRAFT_297943 [Phytophthora sojae]|uniref:Uncharacterized protein n=1 Tax=Phytophthora sojae (strain P6497) TaxID=1094619 RepID=G4Z3G9_PHYSP|nr:hypothetical protein PHYSODRAFT_297943 [Phytophthora sojae]EGZ19341.1 hypothetical protein PHYSODRAFT_297943 [Phytophthora sojae]|eukprot:XP_009522058.1 hypothetical protein PHYSODRAFT_297943 [Phytophthora sojae]